VTHAAPLLDHAESLAALRADPRGKYFVGRSWLSFFAPHGHFSGTLVWGDPSTGDVEAWTACADLRLSDACVPHATIFDASRVERLGPSTFGALARYAARNLSALGARITRLAVVHRGGFAGAVAAGFTKLVPVPFPAEPFSDPEVSRVRIETRIVPPLLRDLALFLGHHPSATPTEAARALALSTRSLQRRLREQDTSFRRELDGARVRLAQRLLEDSDRSITDIALEVGLTSPQHLSTLFHKRGHESPSVWRARMRRPS
jgi:AraC-like DNA-binding protein